MDLYEKVIELAKRRGFLWNSFEVYGGSAGFYDYGPLGSTLKRRIEQIWREIYVIQEGFMEIECPTIGIEDIFVASGHVGGFSDPLCECKQCGEAFRADHLIKHIIEEADGLNDEQLDKLISQHNVKCPECSGELGNTYEFNLMFKTQIGPGNSRNGYMRPETAQGMFVNFLRLSKYYREKLPFGATQIGKSYRNEISPRQGVIRLREFTQAEAEIFIDPRNKNHPNISRFENMIVNLYSDASQEIGESELMTIREALDNKIIAHEFLAYQLALVNYFLKRLGVFSDKLRFRQHRKDEMAHYAIDCWDAEILTDRFGWVEVVGIADRTDYDLTAHANMSKTALSIYIEYDKPEIIEKLNIRPNMSKMGPLFKNKAKEVASALKELKPEELNQQEITVKIKGEKYIIPKELVEYTTETVKINGENIVPHVIEPSFGIDRILYAVMEHAYFEDTENKDVQDDENRIVMKFKKEIAPIKVGVFPLLNKKEMNNIALMMVKNLRTKGLLAFYDDSGSIGRRYRRNDEIGTPYCVTIDHDTLSNNTVTIRDRDSMQQIRVRVNDIEQILNDLIYENLSFESME